MLVGVGWLMENRAITWGDKVPHSLTMHQVETGDETNKEMMVAFHSLVIPQPTKGHGSETESGISSYPLLLIFRLTQSDEADTRLGIRQSGGSGIPTVISELIFRTAHANVDCRTRSLSLVFHRADECPHYCSEYLVPCTWSSEHTRGRGASPFLRLQAVRCKNLLSRPEKPSWLEVQPMDGTAKRRNSGMRRVTQTVTYKPISEHPSAAPDRCSAHR